MIQLALSKLIMDTNFMPWNFGRCSSWCFQTFCFHLVELEPLAEAGRRILMMHLW